MTWSGSVGVGRSRVVVAAGGQQRGRQQHGSAKRSSHSLSSPGTRRSRRGSDRLDRSSLRQNSPQSFKTPQRPLVTYSCPALVIIAGNGRFPFLALQGARSLGHDVTVVAVKEEAFPELEQAARDANASFHSVSLGHLGKCIKILQGGRGLSGGHGRPGQARQDLLRHRPRPDAAVGADQAQGPEHRRADLGGGRSHARRRDRAAGLDRVSRSRCWPARAC